MVESTFSHSLISLKSMNHPLFHTCPKYTHGNMTNTHAHTKLKTHPVSKKVFTAVVQEQSGDFEQFDCSLGGDTSDFLFSFCQVEHECYYRLKTRVGKIGWCDSVSIDEEDWSEQNRNGWLIDLAVGFRNNF